MHYLKDDFDGRTEWYGVITEKYPDHLIFKDLFYGLPDGTMYPEKGTPVSLWVDDWSAEDYTVWE